MTEFPEHWWILHVLTWMQIGGFVVFGGAALLCYVILPTYQWARDRGKKGKRR